MNGEDTKLFKDASSQGDFIANLGTAFVGRKIDYRERIDSTNDLALESAKIGANHGTVFVADVQDAGRGRRGRSWESPPGLSLLFSILLRPRNLDPMLLGWIPLAAGLGAAHGLNQFSSLNVSVKWPNDLVVPGTTQPGWRKLGGILCESVLGTANDSVVIVGIGLNINQRASQLPEVPKSPPTSILLETGQSSDRLAVFSSVLQEIEKAFAFLEDASAFSLLRQDVENSLKQTWQDRAISLYSPVTDSGSVYFGSYAGLDDYGRIRIIDKWGEHVFADAEIINLK